MRTTFLFLSLSLSLALLAGCADDEGITTEIPDTGETIEGISSYTSDDASWTGSGSGGSSSDDTDEGSGGSDDTDSDSGVSRTWYADCDGDGYGADGFTRISVNEPTGDSCDDGGDWSLVAGDCDDSNAAESPGEVEVSTDGVDNDCDGYIDEGASTVTCYADDDGDGYGNAADSMLDDSCGTGYTTNSTDCDDSEANVHPGAGEGSVVNGVDDDCDTQIDEGIDEGDGTVTVDVCNELDYSEVWVLYVNDLDGSDQFWFADVFLDQDDADGCRTFETACDHDLEFQGFGEDSPLWGEYTVGAYPSDPDDASACLVESADGDYCSTAVISVDGVELSEFDNDNLVYRVTCD